MIETDLRLDEATKDELIPVCVGQLAHTCDRPVAWAAWADKEKMLKKFPDLNNLAVDLFAKLNPFLLCELHGRLWIEWNVASRMERL